MIDEHPDLKLARELIVPGRKWTREDCQQLRELIMRDNIGRKRRILACEMLDAVESFLLTEEQLLASWRRRDVD